MIILHPSALMISRNVCHEITMQYIMFKLFTSETKQHPGFFPMYSRRFKRNHFLFNKFPLIFHNFTFCDKSNRSICGNFFHFQQIIYMSTKLHPITKLNFNFWILQFKPNNAVQP